MVIGEQGLAALALEKFAEVYEIEGGLHWVPGWDFSPLFRSRFLGPFLTSFWIPRVR